MRSAMGGIFTLVILSCFMILLMMFFAFNINYTKAFKVKNYIVSKFEQNEGRCLENSACDLDIRNYIDKYGYAADSKINNQESYINSNVLTCNTNNDIICGNVNCHHGYCYRYVKYRGTNPVEYYYQIATKVDVDFLMMSNGFFNSFAGTFYVTGTTKKIVNKINRGND